MRIRTRLFLGFGALIFLMFALAGIGVNRLHSANATLQDIYNNRYAKVSLANATRLQVYDMSRYLGNMVSDPKKENVQPYIDSLNAVQAQAGSNFSQLTNLSRNVPEEAALVQKVNEVALDFGRYETGYIGLIREGKFDEANALRLSSGLKAQDELHMRLADVADYHQTAIQKSYETSARMNQATLMFTIVVTVIGLLLGLGIVFWIIQSITGGLNTVSRMIANFANGVTDRDFRLDTRRNDEISEVAVAFNQMAVDLQEKTNRERELNKQREEMTWLNSNIAHLATLLQGVGNVQKVAKDFVGEVSPMVGASYGALYLFNKEQKELTLQGVYAGGESQQPGQKIRLGQGLVGQCGEDGKRILLDNVPGDYVRINSGLGDTAPLQLVVHPVLNEGELIAVLELASLRPYSRLELELISQLCGNLGIMLNSILGRSRMEELLRISQALTEELQSQSEELLSQQEELRISNEKLEEQTRSLKISEELLQRQQGELEHSNEELTSKTRQLEEQIRETEQINRQIGKTKAALEKQALQLAMSSKYKSEFLANMSHELRTPLNSMLILSQLLFDNKEGNLTGKQVEFAGTIHSSGYDLLKLIDEILDLSKVEAGKMAVHPEYVVINDIASAMERSFQPIARKNGVEFRWLADPSLPDTIYTDAQRLQQVLRNLLSNAFKFTKEGSVTLDIRVEETPESLKDQIKDSGRTIVFAVSDTGIGIPANKQGLIFEAFQQADGTTSRRYGGTGLGLSISRELAGLLGGTIELESQAGKGSTFTLYLPENVEGSFNDRIGEAAAAREEREEGAEGAAALQGGVIGHMGDFSDPSLLEPSELADDRDNLETGDKVLLLIEDDVNFARIIMDMARERGFKTLAALRGDKGLALVHEYKPDAIILDIQLPVINGWSILHHIKHDVSTRHIPVHVMSVVDDKQHGLNQGAIAYLTKPSDRDSLDKAFAHIESFLERRLKKLLIVEDDDGTRQGLVELIGHDDVAVTGVASGSEALEQLESEQFDCMVLDLGLSDISGFQLLDRIRADEKLRELPVIIYTGQDLDHKEEIRLKKYAESIIIKNEKSQERLFDETALFLHRVESNLPEDKRMLLEKLHKSEAAFDGKQILLVDDDIRNVFALSSVLENYNMQITFAENGKEAIDILEKNGGFDLVLMDIMMPEMDGYEAMREIRSRQQYERLPIIALTAKAMKDDRNKCLEAGASDYIMKPIDTDQLLSLLKVWLY